MKLRSQQEAATLGARTVAVLLGGWSATPPHPVEGPPDDELFDLFQQNTAGIVRLWREHEAFLRGEARRLGIAPEWTANGRPAFFGEHCAAPGAARGVSA